MSDAQLIWRLGRWVAQRPNGSVTLSWAGKSVTLRVMDGRVTGVTGETFADAGHGTETPTDALEDAVAAALRRGLPETEGLAVVKKGLEESLVGWLEDPHRGLRIVEGASSASNGPTISLRHIIVETILVSGHEDLAEIILPDLHVVLRRSEGFLDQYASLQLTEEADLIVAKLTGNRTAEEILERTPHDREEVLRLLAALVAAGLLEPVPVAVPDEELAEDTLLKAPEMEEGRRFPVRWIITGALVLLVLLAGAAFLISHTKRRSSTATDGVTWGVVVDRGCEPKDLQRILNKAGRYPETTHAQPSDSSQGAPCWELIWGEFPTREEAESAIARVPHKLRRNGIKLGVERLEDSSQSQGASKGDGRAPG